MEAFRYYLALTLLVCWPPAIAFWFLIHPLVRFWRFLGVALTYTVALLSTTAVGAVIFQYREPLLAVDFGSHRGLMAAGLVLLAGASWIAVQHRRQLTRKVLVGLPEISPQKPGRLITEGIYGRIRHPRYVEVFVATVGLSLYANYLGPYILVLLLGPALYLIVLLEERELCQRFGRQYEEYCRRVPRFIPRRTRSLSE